MAAASIDSPPAPPAEACDPPAGDGETGPDAIDAGIIIVHYRTPELLARCLESIAASGTRRSIETLIVDNDPLDARSLSLAERHGCRYLRSDRNLGYGRGINRGLAECRGRHFLILNPDIEVGPGSIDALIEFMDAHPEVGIAGPKLFSPDGSLQYSARTFYTLPVILLRRTPLGRLRPRARIVRDHLMMDWDHQDEREVDWLLGGALIVRRAAVDDVGGMDERFFLYFEDVDWCNRMHRRGWRVFYVPRATMVHAHQRASAGGFLTRGQRMHLESALRFYEKWSLVLYLWKRQATAIRAAATLSADLVLLSAAFLAAYFTRYLLGLVIPDWSEARPVFALRVYSRFIPFADLVAIITFSFLGLYRGEVWRNRWTEGLQLAKGMLITSLLVLATTFLFTTRPLSRFTVVIFFPYGLLFVAVGRELLRRLVAGARERRIQLRRLAVFAPRERIAELKGRFARHGTFGYEPVYLAHEDEERPGREPADPELRRLRLVAEERIAEVLIFDSREHSALVDHLLPRLLRTGLPVTYVPLGERHLHAAARVRSFLGFGGLWLVQPVRGVHAWGKRAADLAVALPLLCVGLPFHLLQLLASGGRGLAREVRIGRRGRPIEVALYAAETRLLRALPWVRHYPKLAGVWRGELSMVGLVPLTQDQWAAADPDYRRDPPDAPAGLLHPCLGMCGPGEGTETPSPGGIAAPPAGYAGLEALLAWNRSYVTHWSPGEDLRVAMRALLERSGPEEREA
ncbi:MAG: glycosyltransferase [Candidatus Eisenbacteria bacterium]